MLPQHIWKNHVKDAATWTNPNPVGTGAFVVKKASGQVMSLDANPLYYQAGLPKIKTLQYLSFSGNTSSNAAINSGQIDWSSNYIPNIEKTYLSRNPKFRLVNIPLAVAFLVPNMKQGPMTSLPLRQAVSYAIDRSFISKSVYGGHAPATNPDGLLTPNYAIVQDPVAEGSHAGLRPGQGPGDADGGRLQEGLRRDVPEPGRLPAQGHDPGHLGLHRLRPDPADRPAAAQGGGHRPRGQVGVLGRVPGQPRVGQLRLHHRQLRLHAQPVRLLPQHAVERGDTPDRRRPRTSATTGATRTHRRQAAEADRGRARHRQAEGGLLPDREDLRAAGADSSRCSTSRPRRSSTGPTSAGSRALQPVRRTAGVALPGQRLGRKLTCRRPAARSTGEEER